MDKYGTTMKDFAKIRAKASRHAAKNPLALFKKEVSEEEVLESPIMWPGVMTRLMACPPTCGGAAAILVSENFANKHGIDSSIRILAQSMTTDYESTFADRDMMQLVGYDMSKEAAKNVYNQAGVDVQDIDVVELHDCLRTMNL